MHLQSSYLETELAGGMSSGPLRGLGETYLIEIFYRFTKTLVKQIVCGLKSHLTIPVAGMKPCMVMVAIMILRLADRSR